MRTYNKKSILQKICTLSFAVLSLVLVSCGALTNMDMVKDSDGDLVRITIGVSPESRTAYPMLTEKDFEEYILNCDGVNKGWWQKDTQKNSTAYEVMNQDPVYVTKGTHTFVLEGREANGAKYSATVTKNITQADEISFALKFVDISVDGTGTLKINVTYPTENLSKIEVKRYNSADERTYKTDEPSKTTTVTSGLNGTYSYTEGNASIDVGAYIIEFNFYGADGTLLCDPWPELAYISKGLQSVSSINIPSYDDVYAINYDAASLGGAEFTRKPLRYTWRSEITLPAADEVTRTGYTLEGWYLSCDGDGNPTGEPVTGWTGAEKSGPVTLYAKWTPNTYNIKYYTNLASDGALSETPFVTQTAGHGTTLTAPATNPERGGYTFAHWTTGEDNAAFDFENTAITGDTNLYAVWYYCVVFSANSDDATGDMEAELFLTSWLSSESKALTANAYELEGYSFLGWADVADADEADYADGADASFGVVRWLYAVWHDNSEGFVVAFEPNGGTAVASQVVTSDGTATEPSGCTKEGYALIGWYTSEDNGTTLSTAAYDFATPVTANIKLYAKWLQSVYYVSASGNNTTGDGTETSPYATVAKAVTAINTVGNADTDFVIAVTGEILERVSLTTSNLASSKANSLMIRGATGNSTDKLNGSSGGTVLTLNTAVPVTLADITITNGAAKSNAGGVMINAPDATLTLESGALITANKAAGGWNSRGVGVYIQSGSLVMKDGSSISDNNINAGNNGDRGGGVYLASGATFTMDGGVISGNELVDYDAGDGGAGVYVAGTFTMNGGEISGNRMTYSSSAMFGGGGVMVDGGTFTMTGGIISENTTKSCGGAVYVNNGTFNMSGSAYIPYGGSQKNNDVFLPDNKYINVAGVLEPPVNGSYWANPVATITTKSVGTELTVLTASDGVTLADEAPKFAMSNISYKVGSDGKTASRSSYSITYKDASGSAFSGTHQIGYPVSHGVGTTTTLRSATKDYYTFGGWFLTSDCTGDAVTQLTDENCTAAITLYAKWIEIPYFSITYKDAGDADYTGSNSLSLVTKHYAGETETLVNAVKSSYLFDAWYLTADCSGEPVTTLTDANCTADITIYAKWKPHYTITYKDEGNEDFSGTETLTNYFNEGTTLTLPTPTKSTGLFAGWYFESDCSGDAVTALNDLNCTADTVLYAKWRPHYTITYKDAGGADFSGTLADGTPTQHKYGTATTLKSPSKTGSVFLGWYIDWYERDGKYFGIRNALTTLSGTGYKNDITLYALWAEESSTVQFGTHTLGIIQDANTFTATGGFVSYSWFIDGEAAATDPAWSVSADGTTLTIDTDKIIQGYVYTIKVRAYDENGVLFEKTTTQKW